MSGYVTTSRGNERFQKGYDYIQMGISFSDEMTNLEQDPHSVSLEKEKVPGIRSLIRQIQS